MDTPEFLLTKLKEHWGLIGRAIDDLKDSYHQCNMTTFNTQEWQDAASLLDEDFMAVQEHFEALNAIDALYRDYQSLVASNNEQLEQE